MLKSNIAACHLKLEEWKEAITAATSSLDGLDKLEKEEAEKERVEKEAKDKEDEVEEEIVSSGATTAAPAAPSELDAAGIARKKRREDISRIRYKALMRRGRARSEAGGWSNLSGAEEDYKFLSTMTNLTAADKKLVQSQLRVLPPKAKAAQEKETAEMWGKLKDVSCPCLSLSAPWAMITADSFIARKWLAQTLWIEYRQLPDAARCEDWRLQYELQTELSQATRRIQKTKLVAGKIGPLEYMSSG